MKVLMKRKINNNFGDICDNVDKDNENIEIF